ncbi:MAG: type 1 glutamine amidotransferase [Gemmobacter sp.]|uniref:type 1 glutamine amidotransferase n=1 Tax=Gemmobacter sp. TaxID=1898957 RepID=UPI003919EF18
MRVAIVENTAITHHGQVGVALHEAAARIGLYKPFADGRLPDPAAYDALVVFGGEQAATDDHTHPYLPALARQMMGMATDGKAVLGICLGAQVFARGAGAENRLGAAPEFGWRGVRLTESGRADPVLGAVDAEFRIFQWHSDTFTLPPGAAHLAQNDATPAQAFRVGRAGYGMQFHFEASRAVVEDWNRSFPAAILNLSPGWLEGYAEARTRDGAAADAAGLALARAWVARI